MGELSFYFYLQNILSRSENLVKGSFFFLISIKDLLDFVIIFGDFCDWTNISLKWMNMNKQLSF